MEVETIKEDAKKSVVEQLNRLLQVEYDMLFNYPKVIDKLVNVDKINDVQLNESLEEIGKDSLRHFDDIDKIIRKCDGECIWNINVVGWSVDVEELLLQLLEKENYAISWYKAVNRTAGQNRVKVGGLLSGFTGRAGKLPEDYLNVDELISILESHIADEEKHISMVKAAVDRLRMLKNK